MKWLKAVKCFLGYHGDYEGLEGLHVPQPNRYCGRCGKQMKS